MGPSHFLVTPPPYWQPALAGGAEAISAPAVSAVASAPTMYCFMVLPFASPLATMLTLMCPVFAAIEPRWSTNRVTQSASGQLGALIEEFVDQATGRLAAVLADRMAHGCEQPDSNASHRPSFPARREEGVGGLSNYSDAGG